MTSNKMSNLGIFLLSVLFFVPCISFVVSYLFSDSFFVFKYDSIEYNYSLDEFYTNSRLTLLGFVLSVAFFIFVLFVFYYRFYRKEGDE